MNLTSYIKLNPVLALILMFWCLHPAFAQTLPEKKISGAFSNVPLKTFLDQIGKENGIRFYFRDEWIDNITVNQSFDNEPLIKALNSLLKDQPLVYRFFQDNAVVIFPAGADGRMCNKGEALIQVIGDPLNEGRFKKAKLLGHVTDGKDGTALPGAIIRYDGTTSVTSTNALGDFELDLPTGRYSLHISSMGYEPVSQEIKLIEDGSVSFELFQETHNLDEVIVMGGQSKATKAQMSMVKLNAKTLKELPVMMGEPDIIKSIVMLPGIQSVGEMSSGFNVRGGNTDQNLVLLNGAPVFNTSHLFGFFSMINPDGVKDVTLFKGGMPAFYGERVASVMDVQMKEGDTSKLQFYGGLGVINSRFTLEGPYRKNKQSTFLIGGRSTYSDWILRQTRNENFINSTANFYDINAATDLVLGNNNHMKLMGYFSSDKFNLNSTSLYNYQNQLTSADWQVNILKKLVSGLNLAYSRYSFWLDEKDPEQPADGYRLKTGVEYASLKYSLTLLLNDKHKVSAGFQRMQYLINLGGIASLHDISNVAEQQIPREHSVETGLFLHDDMDLGRSLALNLGIRYAGFACKGPATVYLYQPVQTRSNESVVDSIQFSSREKIKSWQDWEPRLSLKYTLPGGGSLRFSLQRVHQFVTQLSNTSISLPSDFWKSCDFYTKPLVCDQVAMGYFKNLKNGTFETSAEIYYKSLRNLTEYKNGAQLVMNRHSETDMIPARGYAYGLELYAKKTSGRFNGWLSYTWSRSMRKTTSIYPEETLNRGEYYPSPYDKPHDLTAVVNYRASRRWRFSGNFVLSSGRPVTLPEMKYQYENKQIVYYSDRNKYRMPIYHRLDLSITLEENLRKKRMWKGSWTFSVYNVYGRKNPYSIFYRRDPSIQQVDKAYNALYKLSVIGVPVPSITYNFKF